MAVHFTKDGRIHCDEYGDITADVLEELAKMSRRDELVIVEREQAEVARVAGTQARNLACGRLVAQFDPRVYDYWLRREGPGFWSNKANLRKFLRDNPACRVDSRSAKTTLRMARTLKNEPTGAAAPNCKL